MLTLHAVSGHGSQKPNTNGTEKDGKDEGNPCYISLPRRCSLTQTKAIWPSDVQVRKYEKDAGNIILDDVSDYFASYDRGIYTDPNVDDQGAACGLHSRWGPPCRKPQHLFPFRKEISELIL